MTEVSEELVERLERANKEAKKLRSQERVSGLLKNAGRLMPKGIKNPDSMITNRHLYTTGLSVGRKSNVRKNPFRTPRIRLF